MLRDVAIDPILGTFCQALAELPGPALDRVILFGSRARGEAKEDSDYDVAVFLKEAGRQSNKRSLGRVGIGWRTFGSGS